MWRSVATALACATDSYLRPGGAAGVVLFDPATAAGHTTFAEAHRLSTGVREVWVNRVRVLFGGKHIGATPYRVVSGRGHT